MSDEQVERVAQAIFDSHNTHHGGRYVSWNDDAVDWEKDEYRAMAKAAIAAMPAPVEWDARYNRHYEPVEKRAAEIYAGFIYPLIGTKPGWIPNGNSTKQDEARDLARAELREAGHGR